MSAADMAETFRSRLRSARLRHRYTQQRLAELAGLSVGTVRDVEHGRRVPGLLAAVALAHALGCTITDLTGE